MPGVPTGIHGADSTNLAERGRGRREGGAGARTDYSVPVKYAYAELIQIRMNATVMYHPSHGARV